MKVLPISIISWTEFFFFYVFVSSISLIFILFIHIGSLLLAADYSQLELRILAHLSGDKHLLNSLNSGDDVFKKIASVWKDIPLTSVTKEMREQAKKVS